MKKATAKKKKILYPEHFKGKDGNWYLRIKSRNGLHLIKASEGNGYGREAGVLHLLEILRNCEIKESKRVKK